MFPTNQNFLSANAGLSNGNSQIFPMFLTSAPTTSTIYAPYGVARVGQEAIVIGVGIWKLLNLVCQNGVYTATWVQLADSDGAIQSVLGTTNQITATNVAGVVTLTTPTTFIAPGSIAATTTVTATLGNITATNGNIVRGTAGNKDIYTSVASTITAGANSAGTVTLVAGEAVISTTAVTAASQIRIYRQGVGATGAAALGVLSILTRSAGVSFTIRAVQPADATAAQATDVSVIAWEIVN